MTPEEATQELCSHLRAGIANPASIKYFLAQGADPLSGKGHDSALAMAFYNLFRLDYDAPASEYTYAANNAMTLLRTIHCPLEAKIKDIARHKKILPANKKNKHAIPPADKRKYEPENGNQISLDQVRDCITALHAECELRDIVKQNGPIAIPEEEPVIKDRSIRWPQSPLAGKILDLLYEMRGDTHRYHAFLLNQDMWRDPKDAIRNAELQHKVGLDEPGVFVALHRSLSKTSASTHLARYLRDDTTPTPGGRGGKT